MIIWVLIALFSLLFFIWIFKKPCLIYNCEIHKYEPTGLRIWLIPIILIVAIVPILNIIAVVFLMIGLVVWKNEEDLEWNEIFPNNSKFFDFWNKKL